MGMGQSCQETPPLSPIREKWHVNQWFGALLVTAAGGPRPSKTYPTEGIMTMTRKMLVLPRASPVHMLISQGLDVTLNDVFVFPFSGSEPLGTYVLFALLTPPNAFTDGRVDAGDILVIDTTSFTTTTACCRVCTIGQACGDSCIPVAL